MENLSTGVNMTCAGACVVNDLTVDAVVAILSKSLIKFVGSGTV